MVDPKAGKSKSSETALPLTRIRTIMKSSVDTGNINNDALFLVGRSTEMFIQHLAKNAFKNVKDGNNLKYEHLSSLVKKSDNLEFLLQIVPEKITVKEFKKRIAEEKDSDETSSESEEEPEPVVVKKKTPNKK